MKIKDLMYNPTNGKLLLTIAKKDSKVYQGYLAEGFIKIGTATGFNMVVNGITNNP
jgi:hypothetical protein